MHSKSRQSAVILVENLDRREIERIKNTNSKKNSIIDYDVNNEANLPCEDFIFKTIKRHFILNLFVAICTSFSFPKLPNVLEINNKSCLQFIKLRRLNFSNFKQTVLSNPFNTIHFFIAKEVMQYKLYLNKQKYKNYIKNKDTILPLLEFNNNSCIYNKVFVEHCLNLPAATFYCFYQILKMFILYAKPIFYHNLKTPRFVFSHKRAKQNSSPLPNVYQIPLLIFNNLLKKIPQTFHFNFNKVFNATPLKQQIFSTDYCYYSIFQIDSCMAQMDIADRIFANTNIEFCSNKWSVFDHVFNKIKHKTEHIKADVVNSYSKRYMLNEFIKGFTPNKSSCITLNEYVMLSKCLMNSQSMYEIQFKLFLDKFEQIYLNTISKKYVDNFKKNVKPMSKSDFIKSFNLQFKQEDKQADYLEIKKIKIEDINKYSDELKDLFKEYKRPMQSIHSILNTTNTSNYFTTRNDFIQFNQTNLKALAIKGTKLECECNLQINKVKKMCDESWMSYSNILNSYLSKTYLSRKIKSNYIKIHILQNAYTHLHCCLTDTQFDFISTQTKFLDTTWKECVTLLDRKLKTIIV